MCGWSWFVSLFEGLGALNTRAPGEYRAPGRKALQSVIGEDKIIVDGAEGIARHLRSILESRNLLSERNSHGEIQVLNSAPGNELLQLSIDLLVSRDFETGA